MTFATAEELCTAPVKNDISQVSAPIGPLMPDQKYYQGLEKVALATGYPMEREDLRLPGLKV